MKNKKLLLFAFACLLSIGLTSLNIKESYATPELYESYTDTATITYYVWQTVWRAQLFTIGTTGPNNAINVTSIKILAMRTAYPGLLNVSIRATSGIVPVGNDIYSGLVNASQFTTSSSGAWYEINMTTWDGTTYLQAATKYAIVIRATSAPDSTYVGWRCVNPGAYSGGNAAISTANGTTFAGAPGDFLFEVWGDAIWGYTFKGIYDEDTGLLSPASSRAVNVTAYFEGAVSQTFEVNGSYLYAPTRQPLYFVYHLYVPRQYWISTIENVDETFYIFNGSLTSYVISFFDLGGVVSQAPFVSAKRLINGSYFSVDKRKVDMENKVQFAFEEGKKYTVIISDTTTSYTFGELLTSNDYSITLTLRGIDFPKETLLTYKYVRVYGLRAFGTPTGSIIITYQDLLNQTLSVIVTINYRNGTNVYNTTQTANSFVLAWLNAANDTDYQVTATINHVRYGTYSWKQYFGRSFTDNPWQMGWLGSLAYININNLVAVFIVLVVGAGFSMINPEVGAFLAACVAAGLSVIGWLPLAPGLLLAAFCFALMFGIVAARRRVQS